ncbi:MAG: DUF5916 domain-containing protein [Vicinamibacterales bacterium]
MLKICLFVVISLVPTAYVRAQSPAPSPPEGVNAQQTVTLPEGFDGAPPPQLPATISRDDAGRTTVRAVRLVRPLTIDGVLDEDIYRTITPISDFIQNEPQNNTPATEKTEVWISFDSENVYVSARMHESQPERMIVNEMRRDSFALVQNENFQFVFDTFHDRQNAVSLQFNPIGGRMDGQVTNGSQFNFDWNPIWRVQTRRHPDGSWTAEAAVPFKSLRFQPGQAQVWGFQARRISRWKNETSYLTALPSGTGINGHVRVVDFATLVGLEVPSGSRPLDLKPYVTSNLTTDRTSQPNLNNKFGKDFGFDAKYAVTQNLTADFTFNTDFAQVEADEQQINLSRFSLFFPEKREFFLENQGLFQFAANNTGNNNQNTSETPTVFYSRRIGLDGGRPVPLEAGGRLSGRLGKFSLGLMNIRTDDVAAFNVPTTNFSVARVRRDILRRSAVGAVYTRRSVATNHLGDAESYGVDGAFAFFQNVYANTYWAQTKNPRTGDDDTSYRGQFFYNADRYGAQMERLAVGEDFDPQLGFMRRQDFHKSRAMLRFNPRPRNRFRAVRQFNYQTSIEYYTNSDGAFESRERRAEFGIEFDSSEQFEFNVVENVENLLEGFNLARGVDVPAGEYKYTAIESSLSIGQQRRVSGSVNLEAGQFYSGTRVSLGFSGARVKLHPQFALEPSVSVNRVDLPFGEFTTKLVSTRATYTITPLMFISGLVQYNSSNHTLGSNVRFRWEYQPGSELFVVYNDGRDTTLSGAPILQNRSIVFKINRLFRF